MTSSAASYNPLCAILRTHNNSNNNTREEDISAAITVIRIAAFFGRPSLVGIIFFIIFYASLFVIRILRRLPRPLYGDDDDANHRAARLGPSSVTEYFSHSSSSSLSSSTPSRTFHTRTHTPSRCSADTKFTGDV